MKNTILALMMIAVCQYGSAQIFINTGNPNTDKYKQENPNAVQYQENMKDTTAVKTPEVKAKVKVSLNNHQMTATTPTKTVTVPVAKTASAPVAKVAPVVKPTPAPVVKVAAPVVTHTAPKAVAEIPNDNKYDGSLSEANNNLPPNAEAGKCYARCFVADQFEFKEETVIDKPVSYKTVSIPATYRTVFDTITVKPASTRYEEIAAVYETVTEDIMVSPATQKWVKSVANAGCLSANPADCQVMCLQEVPAVYKKVARRIVKTPAIRQEHPVQAEYKIVAHQVVDNPARTEQVEIPATYKKVMHKELVRKGGYSDWKEILCASKLTTSKIIAIQTALKNSGYNPGPLDDVFGEQTKTALIKYQQDKNLPVGNLNIETLKALGVE